MQTILEYIINNHINVEDHKYDLAYKLALEIISNCSDKVITEDNFDNKGVKYSIFKPNKMSSSAALEIYNTFSEKNPQFTHLERLTHECDSLFIGLDKTWVEICCDFTHDNTEVTEIYMSFDIRDALIEISKEHK